MVDPMEQEMEGDAEAIIGHNAVKFVSLAFESRGWSERRTRQCGTKTDEACTQ